METIPNYDSWKTRAPEDDADLHERRSRSSGINFSGVGKVTIGGSVIGGNKDDALIKELVSVLGHILFVSCQDGYRELVEYQDIENARAVLKKAKDKGYE